VGAVVLSRRPPTSPEDEAGAEGADEAPESEDEPPPIGAERRGPESIGSESVGSESVGAERETAP